MPKPTKGARLGGSASHQKAILANLATSLFEHGRITTTETRARRMQPLAEKLISKAKRGDLHNRRIVRQTITSADVLHTLFAEIAPMMEGRDGGFTRITKIGPRKGDNAPMAVIQLVTEPVGSKKAASAAAEVAAAINEAAIVEAPEEGLVEAVQTAADDVEADAADEAAAEQTADEDKTES